MDLVSIDRRRPRHRLHTETTLADGEHHYDLILDIAGNSTLAGDYDARANPPRHASSSPAAKAEGDGSAASTSQLRAAALSPFVSQTLGPIASSENAEDLVVLRDLIESGQITPAVDRTYPLAEAAAAVQHLVDGRARGKVVITV